MFRLSRLAALSAVLFVTTALAADPLVDRLLRLLAGLTATSAEMRAPGDSSEAGDIWLVTPGDAPRALTRGGDFRSPVFSPVDGGLFALKGDKVVRLDSSGQVRELVAAPGVRKLIGIDPGRAGEIVVLADGAVPLASLSLKSGALTFLPFDEQSESHQRMLAQVRGQDRSYGDIRLYIRNEQKPGMARVLEWTDVYRSRGGDAPQNLSTCDGVNCGQPALSADGGTVAFIKAVE